MTPASEPTGHLRSLARGGALGLVGVGVSAVLQLGLVVVATRGLGARGGGAFLEAVALFTLLAGLAQMGANTGLVRGLSRAKALERRAELRRMTHIALWPVAAVSTVAAVAVFALASPLARLLFHGAEHDEVVATIRLFAAALPVAPATIAVLSGTRGLGTMVPYVVVQNVALPALRLVLAVAVVAAGLGAAAVAAAWALPALIAFAWGVAWLGRLLARAERAPGSAPARPRAAIASEFWRFAGARGLASVLGMSVTWTDVLLVGALRSTREAGIYAAASRLSIAGAYALQAVGMAIAPQVSAFLARDERRKVESLYRVATWWLMALTWPLYIVLIVFAPVVMGVFGPSFVAGEWALTILSAAMLVNLATGNVTVVLLMSGHSGLNLANAGVSLASNVALNLTLIPTLGMTGAAIAWAVSIVIVNVAPVVQVRRHLGLQPPFGRGYLLVALASVGAFGALGAEARMLLGTSAATAAVAIAAGTVVYTGILYRFRRLLALTMLRESLRIRVGRRAARAGAMA